MIGVILKEQLQTFKKQKCNAKQLLIKRDFMSVSICRKQKLVKTLLHTYFNRIEMNVFSIIHCTLW